jgi:hypothetical protein
MRCVVSVRALLTRYSLYEYVRAYGPRPLWTPYRTVHAASFSFLCFARHVPAIPAGGNGTCKYRRLRFRIVRKRFPSGPCHSWGNPECPTAKEPDCMAVATFNVVVVAAAYHYRWFPNKKQQFERTTKTQRQMASLFIQSVRITLHSLAYIAFRAKPTKTW